MHAIAKIIARHAGRNRVDVGEIVNVVPDTIMLNDRGAARARALLAVPDTIMLNDRGAARARALLAEFGAERVFDPDRVVVVFDHHYPPIRIEDADAQRKTRAWAAEQGIGRFHAGEGIGHVIFPERGYVWPGALVFGTDSHTVTNGALGCVATGLGHSDIASCLALGYNWMKVPEVVRFDLHGTLRPFVSAKDVILEIARRFGEDAAVYQGVEFAGPIVEALAMDERLVLANMVIDFGGKTGYVQPDETTFAYLDGRVPRERWQVETTDSDDDYAAVVRVDLGEVAPLVALPHDLSNVIPAREAGHIRIDEAIFGTCTGGRIEDFRIAAGIMKGRRLAPHARMMVNPGSVGVYTQAVREGLIDAMIEAGAVIGVPGCGPCAGLHQGMLGAGEMGITTASRNFRGRMGSPQSSLIVASPAVVAASAIAGHVVDPADVAEPAC